MAGLEVDKRLVAHAGEGHGENDDEGGDEGEVVGDEPGDGVESFRVIKALGSGLSFKHFFQIP